MLIAVLVGLPLDLDGLAPSLQLTFCQIAHHLEEGSQAHSRLQSMHVRGRGNLTIQCFYPVYSKALIDEIDRALAQHYGLSGEELDFLLQDDRKYDQPGRNLLR